MAEDEDCSDLKQTLLPTELLMIITKQRYAFAYYISAVNRFKLWVKFRTDAWIRTFSPSTRIQLRKGIQTWITAPHMTNLSIQWVCSRGRVPKILHLGGRRSPNSDKYPRHRTNFLVQSGQA